MRIQRSERGITIFAPAKLNLYLDVLSRRPDGYHDLDTVIQAIDLEDRLDIGPADEGVRLRCSAPDLPTDERNLAFRAATAVLEEAGEGRGVEILLTKRIPVGAGLGGGSSDAAAALVGTDRLLGLGLPGEKLERLARDLGSDVPFFLEGGAARCRGRGERVEPIPGARSFGYVVAWPGFGCSTEEVYRRFSFTLTPKNRGASFVAGALVLDDPGQLATGLFNRLEEVVYGIHPELSDLRRTLERFPLLGVGMTGSGSCLFGVLDPSRRAEGIERMIGEATGLQVFGVRGMTRQASTGKE